MTQKDDTCFCSRAAKVKLRSGASIVKVKPLFTFDSKYLLAASGCDVKVFSVASGECVLTFTGHEHPVVSIQPNKKNRLQVLSCSEEGTVIRWDYSDGKALKRYDLNMKSKVSAFFAPTANGPWFVTTRIEGADHHRLYSMVMRAGKASQTAMVMKPLSHKENSVAFGSECSFIAGVFENSLILYSYEKRRRCRHKTGDRSLTCIACHPSEPVVATGDSDGRIIVWSGMLESNQPTRSIYHWHSSALADLAFSSEGVHIYSGGNEAVLVKWNLNSGAKHVVPRLGLPICSVGVSPENTYIVTSHVDNALQILNSQNVVVHLIQGLTQGHCQSDQKHEIVPTGLLYDPRSSALVLNGRPGHLQFYDIYNDKQLFQLDIVGRNYISQEKDYVIFNTDVERAALNSSGLWLATVECRDDGETSLEMHLKFWHYDAISQKFILNTNIFLPHNKKINCLKFCPENQLGNDSTKPVPLAVTTSDDSHFKIWSLVTNDKEKLSWSCELMGYYKDLPAGDACFSEDGSLLAITFDYIITLWTPETNSLKATFSNSSDMDGIRHVLFGRGGSSHLLVCHSDEMLTVWNVLTLSALWTVKCEAEYLAGSMFTDIMALFTRNGNLFLFRPSHPQPVSTIKNISSSPVISAIFVPRTSTKKDHSDCCWQLHSELYFMTKDQLLLVIDDSDEENHRTREDSEKILFNKNQPVTPFGMLQAEHIRSDVKPIETKHHVFCEITKEENELPCPTYTNPVSLCEEVISSLLRSHLKSHPEKEVSKDVTPDEHTVTPGLDAVTVSDMALVQPSQKKVHSGLSSISEQKGLSLDYSFLKDLIT